MNFSVPVLRNHKKNIFTVVLFFLATTVSATESEPVNYEGLIEPFELVNVGSPVEGLVEAVKVKRSSQVNKGDELVQLECSVESTVVKRARALAAVDGDIKLQQEKLAYAKRILARVEDLFQSDAISEEKRDQAATEVELAKARLQKAIENKKVAQLDLQRAQAMLNLRKIKSPISGIVVERFVSPGEFVGNQPLLKVAQMDPLRVEVVLPAYMFRKIKPGMKAAVQPETESGKMYDSVVTIVDKVIDPASGTFGVRLELPNPDYLLPSGLKCLVQFEGIERVAKPDNQLNMIDENHQHPAPLYSKIIE